MRYGSTTFLSASFPCHVLRHRCIRVAVTVISRSRTRCASIKQETIRFIYRPLGLRHHNFILSAIISSIEFTRATCHWERQIGPLSGNRTLYTSPGEFSWRKTFIQHTSLIHHLGPQKQITYTTSSVEREVVMVSHDMTNTPTSGTCLQQSMSGTPPERSIADPTGHIVAVTVFHKLKQASRSKIITPCAPRLLPCSTVDAPSHHVIYLRSFLSAPLMHIAQLLSLAGLRPWTCETCG